jgi:hypothetical protein
MEKNSLNAIRRELEEARKKMEEAIGYDQYFYWFIKAKTLEELLKKVEEHGAGSS